MMKHNDWLYQGASQEIVDSIPAGMAIITLNENNERYFPPTGRDHPYLWAFTNDPGEQLDLPKLEAIEQFARTFKSRGVFVHCMAGSNRSSIICAYLLHKIDGMSPADALTCVLAHNDHVAIRPEISDKLEQLTGVSIRCWDR